MATQTLNYLDAIAHLPAGGTLIFCDVSWREYEELLVDLGERYAARIAYDNGRLEIMSPSLFHEMYKDLILLVAHETARATDIPLESRGSTTFKHEWLGKAAEPDVCFYVRNASTVVGKRRIDLTIDPPPDVLAEIDVSRDSSRKLSFYASLRIPELWLYDEESLRIYVLRAEGYSEADASQAFPLLTSAALTDFLEQSKTDGHTGALTTFRDWLKTQVS
jgi:Uma2 family endonuclease